MYEVGAHTMVFVLVNPAVSFLSLDHEFIIPEPSIDEGVYEGSCKICPCRIHIRGRTRSY